MRGKKGTTNNTYYAIHGLLKSQRGSASKYSCVDCGGPAHEWSYNDSSEDALVRKSVNSNGSPVRYSLDLTAYSPRCRHCHRTFDPHPNRSKTHCRHGHEFTPENTLLLIRATHVERQCRACSTDRNRTFRARKKVAA